MEGKNSREIQDENQSDLEVNWLRTVKAKEVKSNTWLSHEELDGLFSYTHVYTHTQTHFLFLQIIILS